jgi:hypothetical protein
MYSKSPYLYIVSNKKGHISQKFNKFNKIPIIKNVHILNTMGQKEMIKNKKGY